MVRRRTGVKRRRGDGVFVESLRVFTESGVFRKKQNYDEEFIFIEQNQFG